VCEWRGPRINSAKKGEPSHGKQGRPMAYYRARRAAELLLADTRQLTFKRLSAPERPIPISDAYDIQER